MGCNELALSWKDHHGVLFNVFEKLLAKKALVDCTLAAEGKILKAHRIVLSACSPYFETLLNQEYDKHPIIFLRDVHFEDLKTLIEFVYSGEIKIPEDRLVEFLSLAEALQIKGLGGAGSEVPGKETLNELTRTKPSNSPVPRKRSRRQSNGSEDNSSESNDSAALSVEENKRTQRGSEDKVHTNVPSVPSTSHLSNKTSEQVSVDISKVKKEVPSSPVLNQSSCSEQLPPENTPDKNEEILEMKPEFAQVTFTENYPDDLLPEDNNSVEPTLDQDQPSSSHQYSGFVGEPVDPGDLQGPPMYPVSNIDQPPPSEGFIAFESSSSSGSHSVEQQRCGDGVADARSSSAAAAAVAVFEALLSGKCASPPPLRRRGRGRAYIGGSNGRFICGQCGRAFAFQGGLAAHERTHTGERPFACRACGASFAQAGNLRAHERLHTGERPFRCPKCPRAFRQGGHLSYHLGVHHRARTPPATPFERS